MSNLEKTRYDSAWIWLYIPYTLITHTQISMLIYYPNSRIDAVSTYKSITKCSPHIWSPHKTNLATK